MFGFERQRAINTLNNFDKSMYQFGEIHVSLLTNPSNNLKKSMNNFDKFNKSSSITRTQLLRDKTRQ